MPRTPDYNKKLVKELKKYYSEGEMDEFAWWPDVDSSSYYALVFKDHKGRKRQIQIGKENKKVAFK